MSASPDRGLSSTANVEAISRVPSTVWSAEMAEAYARRGVDVVRIAGGPLGPLPIHIIEAGKTALATGRRAPSRGDPDLLNAISDKLRIENRIMADPEFEIVVTNGAMQALHCALQAFVSPGDQVMMFGPAFFVHHLITLVGGEPQILLCHEDDEFHIDPDRLETAISERTTVLILINPGNPTGAVYSRDELAKIADIVESRNLLVISDEAYEKFTYDGNLHTSFASLPGMERRTLTVHSFTKCYGLRGARIGYVAGNRDLITPVLKVFEWSALACNPVSQAMAEAALTGSQDWLDQALRDFNVNRQLIWQSLYGSSSLSARLPEGATFFYLKIAGLDIGSNEFCEYLLGRHGVPTVPGTAFAGGNALPDSYLRVPFGGTEQTINIVTAALAAASEEILGGSWSDFAEDRSLVHRELGVSSQGW